MYYPLKNTFISAVISADIISLSVVVPAMKVLAVIYLGGATLKTVM